MKLTLIFLFLFSTLHAQRGSSPLGNGTKGPAVEDYSGSYALLIGNSDYTGWNKLPGVRKDIQALKRVLEEKHGFTVIVKEELDKQGMDQAFSEFIRDYGQEPSNRLLFYYAGHGQTLPIFGEDQGYLVPLKAENPETGDPREFQNAAFPISRIINEYATQFMANHAIFLFDACFAGTLFNSRGTFVGPPSIRYKMSKPIRYFITSGSAEESVPDKSIFNQLLVEALESNTADLNGDGFLTGTELGSYLTDNVQNYSKGSQNPQTGKIRDPRLDKGDIVFQFGKPQGKPAEGPVIFESPVAGGTYVEIQYPFDGSLFLNGEFRSKIAANRTVSIVNLRPGLHNLKIVPEASSNSTLERSFQVEKSKVTRVALADTAFDNSRTTALSGAPPETGEELLGSSRLPEKVDLSDAFGPISYQQEESAIPVVITSTMEFLLKASGNDFTLETSTLNPVIGALQEGEAAYPAALEYAKATGLESTRGMVRIMQYSEVEKTLSKMKKVLAEGKPLLAAIDVYMSTQELQNGLMTKPATGEAPYGRHAIVLVGYDNTSGLLKFRNSWGPDWGDAGYGYIPYSDFESLIQELWMLEL